MYLYLNVAFYLHNVHAENFAVSSVDHNGACFVFFEDNQATDMPWCYQTLKFILLQYTKNERQPQPQSASLHTKYTRKLDHEKVHSCDI